MTKAQDARILAVARKITPSSIAGATPAHAALRNAEVNRVAEALTNLCALGAITAEELQASAGIDTSFEALAEAC